MGIALRELLTAKEIELKDLSNKVICVDAPVMLYQFLTTIRQADGSYLTDSQGRITSHLIGINSRVARLLQYGIKLVFVFDGKAPDLKKTERERRRKLKEEAEAKYRIAMQEKDFADMKKYAAREVRITPEIINEAKDLLDAYGIPCLEAPSEAEAQASYIVSKGDAYAVATQDTDALMFGCPKIVKNLSIAGKHKRPNRLDFQIVKPELLELNEILKVLDITHEQFIYLSIMVGTDFNPGGVKGIGPKNALKLVKEYPTKEKLKEALASKVEFDFDLVYDTIKNVPINTSYTIQWKKVDQEKVIKILVHEHNFSEERIKNTLKELDNYNEKKKQLELGAFV